ncbi:MAG: RNA-directed polymerase [Patescibacteria group bacterium]|nr:RNA-directed polymerase [Patescibacteria group bacterium]
MAKNTDNLPYYKTNKALQKAEEKKLARFLLRKIRPRLREKLPEHYLIQSIPYKKLRFIKEKSKSHPYFLKFDIRLYYPSICHEALIKEVESIFGKSPSRRAKRHLKDNLPKYLNSSPYGKGITIGSPLSYVFSCIFLLNLDLKIPRPFLRQADDYIIFCKDKKEPEKILREIVNPELKRLNLEINEKKLKSGKFHKDKVDFIGFDFYAGHFTIKESKVNEFKDKIIKITHLTKKKPEKAIIKLLNNKILGFGHYYKYASCRQEFEKLDSFIRMRLRRYLSRNKDSKNKQGNLLLTNEVIKSMGLKSLAEIKASKKTLVYKKRRTKTSKSGQIKSPNERSLEHLGLKYQQKQILDQLKELTSLIKEIDKRIVKIEQKVAKEERTE